MMWGVLQHRGCTVLTTFLDFFRLPNDFPGYTLDGERIQDVEQAMVNDLSIRFPGLPHFIPYIQKYEFEALLFADMEGFNYLVDDVDALKKLAAIIIAYPNPEDINGGWTTAPSKRLASIFNYNKTADSTDMLEIIGFRTIYSKCPRFAAWFDYLAALLCSSKKS